MASEGIKVYILPHNIHSVLIIFVFVTNNINNKLRIFKLLECLNSYAAQYAHLVVLSWDHSTLTIVNVTRV